MSHFPSKIFSNRAWAVYFAAGWIIFSTSACSALSKPIATVTPSATLTPTFTPSFTPTLTPTTTATKTPTDTATPTITLTPTLIHNAPGTYAIKNKCNTYYITAIDYGWPYHEDKYYTGTITFCLTYVFIDKANNMTFGMYYVLIPSSNWGGDFEKASDANNHEIILTDDLKNGYKFIQAQGCAIKTKEHSKSCDGWFLFPPAKSGARSFVLHYPIDRVEYLFDNIVLVNPK